VRWGCSSYFTLGGGFGVLRATISSCGARFNLWGASYCWTLVKGGGSVGCWYTYGVFGLYSSMRANVLLGGYCYY